MATTQPPRPSHFTVAALEVFPQDGNRYEVIDGDLRVEITLKHYARRGAREYWTVDDQRRRVEVYRRTAEATLEPWARATGSRRRCRRTSPCRWRASSSCRRRW